MPFDAMVMSAVVLGIFCVFLDVLAWGDYQTRLENGDISQLAEGVFVGAYTKSCEFRTASTPITNPNAVL
jgi:hypothetical protein